MPADDFSVILPPDVRMLKMAVLQKHLPQRIPDEDFHPVSSADYMATTPPKQDISPRPARVTDYTSNQWDQISNKCSKQAGRHQEIPQHPSRR
ncbi:hypothetical protein CEXT_635471 [Caerostris extrusa]|uniref:Uncharacterized protein n=1 Tax=Caerostris extrusa TaxID=172846 RepID=A0AAV4XM56_CAEEX|nr:hypothetical protein CEXT_635471 [Caerostris extrusa]